MRIQDKVDLKNEEQMAPTKVALLFLCGLLQAEALAAVSPALVRVAASSRGVPHSLAMQATPAEAPNWYKEYAPGRLERLRGAWQAAKQWRPSQWRASQWRASQWRPSQWRPALRSLCASSRPKLSLASLPKRLLVPLGVLLPAGALLTAAASAAGGVGAVSLLGRLLSRFEQLVYARAGLALGVFFVALLTGGGVLWQSTHPPFELWESTWKAYSLLNDIPGADVVHEPTAGSRAVAASRHLGGVLTFAILLGLITDKISTSVEVCFFEFHFGHMAKVGVRHLGRD